MHNTICRMLPGQRREPASLYFFIWTVLLFCPGLHAQQNCNVEVKVLLLPTETQASVSAFGARKETSGRVYFFDTDTLNLLSQGAIVRLRRGARSDLTLKLRPLKGKRFAEGFDGSKCEVDLTGDGENPSYSITSSFDAERVPETGYDVSRLLSAEQMKLFNKAQISVDWTRVKRLSGITSTDWQIRGQPPFDKLTLELWEWPGGKVLELSTKVPPDSASAAYSNLQRLVETKHLSMSAEQSVKTTIALEAITHATAHR
jgi:hypothetical protein